MKVNDVNLDRLIELEGQIIEPVPEAQRAEYVYWRAAHLGNVALNFIKGQNHLNAWGADYTHFFEEYWRAINVAKELASPNPIRQSQFGEQHKQEFAKLTGIDPDFVHPAIILALDKPFNNGEQLEEIKAVDPLSTGIGGLFDPRTFDQPFSPGGGHILRGRLTLNILDRYSKEAIQNIFDPK